MNDHNLPEQLKTLETSQRKWVEELPPTRCGMLLALETSQRERVEGWKKPPPCDKIGEILQKIYSTPSHFIYELLQNADDEGATEVAIALHANELRFSHNGAPFKWKNVMAILSVGDSTKTENQIGKFGIGFKSVFCVTDAPQIHSGGYHFQIRQAIIPEVINNPENSSPDKTTIVLPFNDKSMEQHENIAQNIQAISTESLLFVKKLRKINWQTENNSGCFYAEEAGGGQIRLVSEAAGVAQSESRHLMFSKECAVDGKQIETKIAFLLSGDNITAVRKNLFVFFPMEKESTELGFIVHAPYKTTPSRETIVDDEVNSEITKHVAALVADSVVEINKRGLFNVDFMADVLPINDKKDNLIYNAVYDAVKEKLSKEAILPAADGSFVKSENALLAREKYLIDLQGTASRFGDNKYWLDQNMTEHPDLWKYLKSLNPPVLAKGIREFCENLPSKFMETKDSAWVINFYSHIINIPSIDWRDKPVIRLKDGKHVEPGDGSDIFLPPDDGKEYTEDFRIVEKSIAKNETACKFLAKLSIKKLDNVEAIKKRIMSKYSEPVSVLRDEDREKYLRDFSDVHEIWSGATPAKQADIIATVKNICFILGVNHNGGQLKKPKDIYVKAPYLETWFSGYSEVAFVSPCINEQYPEFIQSLGISDKLKPFYGVPCTPDGAYRYLRWLHHPVFYAGSNIHGLEHAISKNEINFSRSKFLWDLLTRLPSLRPEYEHQPTRGALPAYGSMKSGILLKLEKCPWLYGKDEKLLELPLSEISLDKLHDVYNAENADAEKLAKDLGMDTSDVGGLRDEVSKLKEEGKRKDAEIKRLRQQLEKRESSTRHGTSPVKSGRDVRKNTQDEHEETETPSWKPDVSPQDADNIKISKPREPKAPQPSPGNNGGEKPKNDEISHPSGEKMSAADKREMGKWGEEYAELRLKETHPESDVIWESRTQQTGHSCDFVVRENGVDVAYYEIKSKQAENPVEFDITTPEWRFAKASADKYYIMLISNAGKQNARYEILHNPVQMWEKGEIIAQPVRIKL